MGPASTPASEETLRGGAARRRGPLSAVELTEAAVLADVSVVLVLLGWIVPAGGALYVASMAPFVALATRRRARAVAVGGMAGGAVAFLVAGPWAVLDVGRAAFLGGLIGWTLRRGWGSARATLVVTALAEVVVAPLTVGLLAVLTRLRALALDQVRVGWRGTAHLLRRLGLDGLVGDGNAAVDWIVRHWWLTIPAGELVAIAALVSMARAVARPAVARLEAALGPAPSLGPPPGGGAPGPVPAALRDVSFRYPGAPRHALAGVSLTVPERAFVVVIGANGSGKSTLVRLLAGWTAPTSGAIDRPGAPAPGTPGGTATIFQRPESQVLGARVRDDVRWGAPGVDEHAVQAVLAEVGLAGFAERETSMLSGGELQRLALAAALARRPALLLSDESTTMLDPPGRRAVIELLRRLPRDHEMTVVHVTHRLEEMAGADLVIVLADGRVVETGPPGGIAARALVAG